MLNRAQFEKWMDQWETEEQVLDRCRQLGIKGVPGDCRNCLLAKLIEEEFPGIRAYVTTNILLRWEDGEKSFPLTPVFENLIYDFDYKRFPKEFYL